MIVNIEQEYNNYICNKWQELSDITKDILKLHEKPGRTYIDTMSLWSVQFLQDKLKGLETKKS